MEKRGKPFRSRSFSFGSSRAKSAHNVDSNQLLSVVTSFPGGQTQVSRGSAKKLSFCEKWNTKKSDYHQLNTYHKHREMNQTYLPGRSLCRYICNVLRFIGTMLIFIAFALHLQYQWQMGRYSVEIIVVSTTGVTTLIFVVVLYLFFGLKAFSRSIVHFWVSLMYGIIFVQQTHLRVLNKTIMILVFLSTAVRCFSSLLERIFKLPMYRSQFLSKTELCDLVAFGMTCFLLPPRKCLDLWLEIGTLGFIVMHVRMKSSLCFAITVLYGIVSGVSIIGNLSIITNKYSFLCFGIRMLWDPFLDLYFSNLHPLTRWKCFFNIRRLWIYLFLLFLFFADMIFLVVALQAIPMHAKYEWPIFLPLVIISTLSWLSMHSTYFSMQISFLNRVSECERLLKTNPSKYEQKLLYQVLSKEGLKFLCGTCHGVTSGCVFSTGILGTICWRRKDGTYPAFLLLLFCIEALSLALFANLATYLRGTCYGYGVVASSDDGARNKPSLVLPSNSIEVQTMSASRMMNAVQSFFRDQLIESLGCDCWSRGAKLTLKSVENKLALLFSKRTSDDNHRPYDNYIVYFNGTADQHGSWILADGARLSLKRLLEIWNDRPDGGRHGRSSRLIILTDASNSKAWLEPIKRLKIPIIIQCSSYLCDEKVKTGFISEESWAKRGDFTLLWTSFLKSLQTIQNEELHYSSTKKFLYEVQGQGIQTKYTFSNSYVNAALSPSRGEISNHGCTICCFPVVLITSFLSTNLFWAVTCGPVRLLWFRLKNKCLRQKMHDVGQGFILINSK